MKMQTYFLDLLKNRIDLGQIPFSERGSRLTVFSKDQHLLVRLAERWFKLDGQLSSYRNRLPTIDEFYFIDGDGQRLESEITTYPNRLEFQTPAGRFKLVFVDSETILVSLPRARCGISFKANVDTAQVDRRGGVLRISGQIRRNIAYTTNASILKNEVEPSLAPSQRVNFIVEGGPGRAILINITPRLGFNRYVPDPAEVEDSAARRWNDWFRAVPPVAGDFQAQYYFAWWVLRAGLISPRYYTTREAMTPSKVHYIGVWQWDAYFHALAYRHVDARLAQDQLRILLDHQREDGMIPDAVHDEGTVTHLTFPVEADVTKPPLLAWAAWKLYEAEPDREFLDEIYEPIVRWNYWWYKKNDEDGNGLCEYHHPFSSGLDDSPLWDEGMPVESPDLNTYLCLQQEALARIAGVIEEGKDAEMWANRAEECARQLIRQEWDAEAGLFWARKKGVPIRVRTPFSLFPLVTGRMPKDICTKLVANLTDEAQFWTRYPVPSVALNDPKYDPNQMWRGPTWINVNYLLIEGLQRAGYLELARELRRRTLEMIYNLDDIFEYYHPETGENPPKAAPIFGWSSAIFIDLALQATREMEQR
jgi:putative isomerase